MSCIFWVLESGIVSVVTEILPAFSPYLYITRGAEITVLGINPQFAAGVLKFLHFFNIKAGVLNYPTDILLISDLTITL